MAYWECIKTMTKGGWLQKAQILKISKPDRDKEL